jgi:hypothetical protein
VSGNTARCKQCGKLPRLSVNAQGFVVKGSCIVVPDNYNLRKLIIRETHDSPYAGHYGITKTLRTVGKLFWWPSLKVDVTDFISSCPPPLTLWAVTTAGVA